MTIKILYAFVQLVTSKQPTHCFVVIQFFHILQLSQPSLETVVMVT